MRSRLLHAQNGMTIADMLVTISILAIVSLILGAMFIVFLRTFFIYEARVQLNGSASAMVNRFLDIAIPSFGFEPSRTVGGTLYTSDASTTIMKIASIDGAGNIIANTYDYVVITPNPGNATELYERVDADPASARPSTTKLFGEFVENYAFLYENGKPATSSTASFTIRVAKEAQGSTYSYTLYANAKVRNK